MAGLEVHALGTQEMVLYAGRACPELEALGRGQVRALASLPLVTSHLDAPGARPGTGQLREHFRAVWEVHSLDLRITLVKEGMAVGYLPRSAVAALGPGSGLVALARLPFGVIRRTVGLFHSVRRPLLPLAKAFVELARTVSSPAGARAGGAGRRARRLAAR
jgi:DNA-binding transcriptional LysR family regulator